MKKESVVISLGGSLIYPEKLKHPDVPFLNKFSKGIQQLSKKYRVIVVCGGGYAARAYIRPLQKKNISGVLLSRVGIASTLENALFVSLFLDANTEIPRNTRQAIRMIKKRSLVITGSLEIGPNQTTDANAALLAKKLKSKFINLTDVTGLYDKNPHKFKNAKLIKEISFTNFNRMTNAIKFEAGQHFVLDQKAAVIVSKYNIPTAIIRGNNFKAIKLFLKNKPFTGTLIYG
ncbi:hypothetical protein CL622_08680 [archaeon]|nr:hypothetical protein [archaeon]|tara:strand:- start:845 stop:1540 length:696 start_codon:yes stop_codon:yes gene_type:complete